MLACDHRRVEASEDLRSKKPVMIVEEVEAFDSLFRLWRGRTASYEQSRSRSEHREQAGLVSSHFFFCLLVRILGFSSDLPRWDLMTNLFFTVHSGQRRLELAKVTWRHGGQY